MPGKTSFNLLLRHFKLKHIPSKTFLTKKKTVCECRILVLLCYSLSFYISRIVLVMSLILGVKSEILRSLLFYISPFIFSCQDPSLAVRSLNTISPLSHHQHQSVSLFPGHSWLLRCYGLLSEFLHTSQVPPSPPQTLSLNNN